MTYRTVALAALAVLLGGCQTDQTEVGAFAGTDSLAAATNTEILEVAMLDSAGTRIGSARLTPEAGGGVRVALDVRGLPPGEHAFHIHENGRCDPPSFESAGGHFAPMDRSHGFNDPQGPHAGDMENLTIGPDGTLRGEMANLRVTLGADEANSVLRGEGTALVIHAEADDYQTDPSGDAGSRIACGVIRRG